MQNLILTRLLVFCLAFDFSVCVNVACSIGSTMLCCWEIMLLASSHNVEKSTKLSHLLRMVKIVPIDFRRQNSNIF